MYNLCFVAYIKIIRGENPKFHPALTPSVIPLGFEPKTHSLEGCCSIQLSYGTIAFAAQI